MFKNKSKKLICRILLLMLVDAIIITLSGPIAIYVRYNLLFAPRAIEFIENIFRYLPLNLVITIAAFAGCRLYQGIWKLSVYVFCGTGHGNLRIPFYVPDSGIFPVPVCGRREEKHGKYHDRGCRRSRLHPVKRDSEQ